MRVVEKDSREAVIEAHRPFGMVVYRLRQTAFDKIPPRLAQRCIVEIRIGVEQVAQRFSLRRAKRCKNGRTGRKRR